MNPNWKQIVREHLAVMRLPSEREIEIVEELALHLEAAYEDALAAGLSEAEAEARALRSNDWRLLECELSRAEQPLAARALQPSLELIERKGGIRMGSFIQDLRYGARMLLKNPGFTLIAIITLALGIGANTAIFSVVNTVLLRPLPYPQPERLIRIWRAASSTGLNPYNLTTPDYREFRDQCRFCEQMGAYYFGSVNLLGRDEPERIQGVIVTANLFPLLQAPPMLGRSFLPA
jgi:hypothetical protein